MAALRLAELLAGLSLTIDLAGGAPLEKGLRTCAVATALADALELDLADQRTVYHASLLMGIGCTAHAPENASMFEDARARRIGQMADARRAHERHALDP